MGAARLVAGLALEVVLGQLGRRRVVVAPDARYAATEADREPPEARREVPAVRLAVVRGLNLVLDRMGREAPGVRRAHTDERTVLIRVARVIGIVHAGRGRTDVISAHHGRRRTMTVRPARGLDVIGMRSRVQGAGRDPATVDGRQIGRAHV